MKINRLLEMVMEVTAGNHLDRAVLGDEPTIASSSAFQGAILEP